MSYIANWSNQKIEKFKETVGEVKKITNKILSTIEPAIFMEIKDKSKKQEKQQQDEGEM